MSQTIEQVIREQIHSAMYPGSFGGDIFSEQTEVNLRQHALSRVVSS
jgi:hypothetical protein